MRNLDRTVAKAAAHADQVVGRLFPAALSFELGSRAAFTTSGFNGRSFDDDATDVMLWLLTGTPSGDGTFRGADAPAFSYLGAAYNAVEQEGVAPERPAAQPARRIPVDYGHNHASRCGNRPRSS